MISEVKFGVIGAGTFGAIHAAALTGIRGVRVVGICDADLERASRVAQAHQIPHAFSDVHRLLALDEIDAVTIVTPPALHREHTLAALDAGKHVLVEKPMATTAADARQMTEQARRRKKILMPGHILRFEDQCAYTRQRLASSPIRFIHCTQHRVASLFPLYQHDHLVRVLMIHHLDLAKWFVGAPVTNIIAVARHFQNAKTPDLVTAVLEFANGTVASLTSSWLLPGTSPAPAEDTIFIVTEHERITLRFPSEGLQIRTESESLWPDLTCNPVLRSAVGGALRSELEYFVQLIETGTNPTVVTPDDGIEAVALAERVIGACGGANDG